MCLSLHTQLLPCLCEAEILVSARQLTPLCCLQRPTPAYTMHDGARISRIKRKPQLYILPLVVVRVGSLPSPTGGLCRHPPAIVPPKSQHAPDPSWHGHRRRSSVSAASFLSFFLSLVRWENLHKLGLIYILLLV